MKGNRSREKNCVTPINEHFFTSHLYRQKIEEIL